MCYQINYTKANYVIYRIFTGQVYIAALRSTRGVYEEEEAYI